MKNLNDISGMPQMQNAFAGWQKTITLAKIIQSVVGGFVQDATVQFTFKGVIQPLSPRQIALKPEGQRAWSWLQIHVCALYNAPVAVSSPVLFDSPGQMWDTPGATYDATGGNGLATIWRNLKVNDRIYYNGQIYKIMGDKDYSLNGYIEYHAIEDYQ